MDRHDFKTREIRSPNNQSADMGTYAWCLCGRWSFYVPHLDSAPAFLEWFRHYNEEKDRLGEKT